jgi:hypothetical protein
MPQPPPLGPSAWLLKWLLLGGVYDARMTGRKNNTHPSCLAMTWLLTALCSPPHVVWLQ